MNNHFRVFAAPLAIATAVATLVGCQVPAVTPGQASQIIKQAASFASLGLKMLDDAGIETGLDSSQISKMLVGGKEVTATYDADGNLQVPVDEAGGEQLVEVVLTDGKKIQVPVKAKKGEKFDAFLMSGYNEGELVAEVGARGAKPMDVFKDKTVLFEIGEPALTNENARALFIGPFKTPRHSWFVENGNLRLHASNLWVLMHAKGGPGQPGGQPGGMQGGQPGGMQGQPGAMQPQPGGMQPRPGGQQPAPGAPQAPMFNLAQQAPPPGGMQPQPGGMQPQPGGMQPQPGGMQPQPGGMQPQPGGMQPQAGGQAGADADRKIVLRVAAEVGGKIKVWAFTPKAGVHLPGPPPAPEAGKAPVFKDLPTLKKADFDIVVKEFPTLADLETDAGTQQGKFLPPAPPNRPGAQQPRPAGQPGMQPAPGGQPQPGMQPQPGGQPQPAPAGQPAPGGQPQPAPLPPR